MSDAEEVAFREMFPLVIGALAGLAVLFLVAALFIGGSEGDEVYVPAGKSKEEVLAERVSPIGEVNMGGPKVAETTASSGGESTQASAEPRSPEELYNAVCSTCHGSGVAGAPKYGDKTDWKQRLDARGFSGLLDHALNGFKGMPAKGGTNASKEQIKGTIKYMLDKVGLAPSS